MKVYFFLIVGMMLIGCGDKSTGLAEGPDNGVLIGEWASLSQLGGKTFTSCCLEFKEDAVFVDTRGIEGWNNGTFSVEGNEVELRWNNKSKKPSAVGRIELVYFEELRRSIERLELEVTYTNKNMKWTEEEWFYRLDDL